MMPGAPMSEPVYDGKNVVGHRFLRDADGTLVTEQHHSIRIRLWYETEDRDGSVISYGATPTCTKPNTGLSATVKPLKNPSRTRSKSPVDARIQR